MNMPSASHYPSPPTNPTHWRAQIAGLMAASELADRLRNAENEGVRSMIAARARRKETVAAMLLDHHDGISTAHVMRELGVSDTTAASLLMALVEDGRAQIISARPRRWARAGDRA